MKKKTVIKALSAFVFVGAMLWVEDRFPLRKPIEGRPRRWLRNAAITLVGAALLRSIEVPLIGCLSQFTERKRFGLLNLVKLPKVIYIPLAITLMDYTLYIWHALVHRLPVLWNFHLVHHADLDMDVTTANRFHFGELAISIVWRAMQVLVIGVNPVALKIWQFLLTLSILFHHSNIRLPRRFEEKLEKVIVTPRMHETHHSVIERETNSNFSSGFSFWDRLHKTYRNYTQDYTVIGIAAYQKKSTVALNKMLLLPFSKSKTEA